MSSLLSKVLTNENFVNLESCIAGIDDPRVKGKTTYSLRTLLVIALCATIGGANNFRAMERFGWDHCDWFEELLGLKTSIPSHDTFNDIFNRLNPRQVFDWLSLWLHGVTEEFGSIDTIRIDGKVIVSLSAENPLCFVRAWSDQMHVVLEQVKVQKGTNEITTIPAVLDRLDLDGKTVTIDAIGTQTNIVDKICSKNGDYVLALKKNQLALYDDVNLYMTDIVNGTIVDPSMQYHKDITSDHGRIETRECWVIHNIGWLDNKEKWTNLRSIVLIKSTVRKKRMLSEHVRLFISSHATSAKRMLSLVRGHWSIENQLHWPLDVVFCEDVSTTRDVYGVQNLAACKSTALSLLLQNEMQISLQGKRARAAASLIYLLEVLLNKVF